MEEKLNDVKIQRDVAIKNEENIRKILGATAHTLKKVF